MTLGGKTAVARQRGRRPPQILAARDSPSRGRGRPRVGSSTGPPVRRRNAETRVRPHLNAARRQNSCSSATRETTPQFLAARGSPSRWRGRWRVGSIIPCRAFVQQTPNAAKLRPPRPPRPELRGANMTHAKKGREGGVCEPRMFCASKMPGFLARWRVRGRPAVRGPAGTGSVGDGVGEGDRWSCFSLHLTIVL